jgi:hypothetical protein
MTGIVLTAVALWLALQLPLGMLFGHFLRKGRIGMRPQPSGRFAHYAWPRRGQVGVFRLDAAPILIGNVRRDRLPRP